MDYGFEVSKSLTYGLFLQMLTRRAPLDVRKHNEQGALPLHDCAERLSVFFFQGHAVEATVKTCVFWSE